ncbi:MAG: ferrous iron transport protein B [Candidatus Omnitrophica bacterium]|nr:ferrous iron transport protein B [Candidatus Omnitrophota bacterium]
MKHKKIVIVGAPNVGKSSIFNDLSGRYATVSNYPGTTVEIFRATIRIKDAEYEIIDTPGMYSLLPLSEEERIARLVLAQDNPDVVLHVVAARELLRTLPLTLQLKEAGLPVILVLNIMDEAAKEGTTIDIDRLSVLTGVPVIPTISITHKGIRELKNAIANDVVITQGLMMRYSSTLEEGIEKVTKMLTRDYAFSKKAVSLLLLESDKDIFELTRQQGEETDVIDAIKKEIQAKLSVPIEYVVNLSCQEHAAQIISSTVRSKRHKSGGFLARIDDATLKPLVGLPLLLLFLYVGLYKFVGEFGAGTLVDFLETFFTTHINPPVTSFFQKLVPYPVVTSLFVGDYGIITLGVRYAVAIVLPIVGIFFLVFSFAEDTGYLPRMGAMLDRLFKRIGLSGRAVIPIVLGLGCDTMATMVTRVLPSKRERIIATFLLSLSVPCSAQLGVIMAVLSKSSLGLVIWFFTITGIFTVSGFLLNKILKGKRPSFYIELPPLRLPRLSNILIKTYSRLIWYFKEVLPLFIWASVLIWIGQITKIFDITLKALHAPLRLMGLPDSLSSVFLFGFFRRDYGAAGLYDLEKQGALALREIIVCAVVLTLFLPCIAQFLMNIKERGIKMALGITVFILVFSFSAGIVLNRILVIAGL